MTFRYIILFFSLVFAWQISAQCRVDNNTFQAGEDLRYDMYFKYGLINAKAGNTSLRVTNEKYNNKDALKMTLMAKSSGVVKSVFSLADTLSCIMSKDLVPLAYLKNAFENDDYTIEKATYSYEGEKVHIKTSRVRNDILRFDENLTSASCIYDMLSIVYYARTLDYSTMKEGQKTNVAFLSGKRMENMDIVYQGTEAMKANDGNKYDCIKLVLIINGEVFEDQKEAMKVYITNDPNRIPVRIDSKLKVGSTRAILKSYQGLKY
ncbi:hypothetical protein M2459_003157 [Parabacteroides sp. PF5-5]|uniref:DUF3108 domain-containing protein n=1 Tax=unclassified Parabacteroides TaxID=2649774 RepID=UPI00247331D0|nr:MULTISPECIES: DUF3108 domain-containing protein [unclassified Parabacteroides]MDH6306433.1 hypothetical protein [Parabacteroides sp. PH5-39]MDH6317415.1 hypothetical protein [Parabacteroides sp. PF5-13]MDH6321144.1 hypothetical protein [Parabacteroides sp. PH5-13]MDH6324876.1 hypothetical protein [Parabacteroides sp. PH5-8]MDH6328600.1 hypothetical protein [Parabacteroides sp. PH5-41]